VGSHAQRPPHALLHDVQATLLLAAPHVVAASLQSYLISRRVGVERRDAAVRAAAVGMLAVHLLAVVTATRLAEVLVGGGDDHAVAQIELVPLAGISSYLRSGVSATALVQVCPDAVPAHRRAAPSGLASMVRDGG
jgi:hypothetical protein